MKRSVFIGLFICVHVMFIALKIDKQSKIIQLCYEKQKLEKEKISLISMKKNLTSQLYAMQNPTAIKTFAQKKLNFTPLNLHTIKRLPTS